MDSSIYFDNANGDSMQTRNENVALREQIDQAFMFEEIVGSSTALQMVLSSVLKVAPTDSTVLITGETGTGKELFARAIHKRSHRSKFRSFRRIHGRGDVSLPQFIDGVVCMGSYRRGDTLWDIAHRMLQNWRSGNLTDSRWTKLLTRLQN
jgi:hypothetical protein